MPPRLFKNIGFDAIVIIAAVGAMLYYSLTVLWPQIISALYETDSIKVGIQSSVVVGDEGLEHRGADRCSWVPSEQLRGQQIAARAAASYGQPEAEVPRDAGRGRDEGGHASMMHVGRGCDT